MPIETRTRRILAAPGECPACSVVVFTLVDPFVVNGTGQVKIYNLSGGCPGCAYEFSVDGVTWTLASALTATGNGGYVFGGLSAGDYTMRGRCQGDSTTEGTAAFTVTVPPAQVPKVGVSFGIVQSNYSDSFAAVLEVNYVLNGAAQQTTFVGFAGRITADEATAIELNPSTQGTFFGTGFIAYRNEQNAPISPPFIATNNLVITALFDMSEVSGGGDGNTT